MNKQLDFDKLMNLFNTDNDSLSSNEDEQLIPLDDENIERTIIENDKESLNQRNKQYNEILDSYSNHIKNTLDFKQRNRDLTFKIFIWTFIIVILSIFLLIVGVCWYGNFKDIRIISLIITSLLTLITSLIVIPTKITEFIYNPNEDTQIGEIIKNLQDYDKALRDHIE